MSPSGSVVWVQSTVIESSASVPVFCSKVAISTGGKFSFFVVKSFEFTPDSAPLSSFAQTLIVCVDPASRFENVCSKVSDCPISITASVSICNW